VVAIPVQCAKCDAELLRVKMCEHIAEGEEGWDRPECRNVCPSTMAVAELRDKYEALLKRESDVEDALRSELAAYKAVYEQAIKLSRLMDEVPEDNEGQNDRVFAHFEFDELRYAFTLVNALKGAATTQIEGGSE